MKLYTTNWCAPCTVVKNKIKECGYNIVIVDVDVVFDLPRDVRTVPTLEVGGEYITGSQNIIKRIEQEHKDGAVPNT